METIKNIKLVNNSIDFKSLKLLSKEDLNKVLDLCKSHDKLHTKIVEDRLKEDNELDITTLFSAMLFTCIELSKN